MDFVSTAEMRLWILSDWHLEMQSRTWTPPCIIDAPSADVVVVAGDVHSECRMSAAVLSGWSGGRGKQVVFVPGNHEFYGGMVMQDDLAAAQEIADAKGRVHLLARRSVVIDGVRFVGCTLWTDYRLHGDPKASMIVAGQTMNDHQRIRIRETEDHVSRFMPWHAAVEHRLDLAFLVEELERQHDGPTVVVTHHLPSVKSVAPRFIGSSLNPAFASDLDWLIDKHQPELWVHGHTHDACDYLVGRTRVICNPVGYGLPGEGRNGFRHDLVIEP
jgi:Icc-related predicted phosphoesterase